MPCPRRGGPGVGEPGDRDRVLRPPVAGRYRGRHQAIVRCRGPPSHPARTWPAGIDWDTVRALAADAGDTGPGQRGHLARVPAADARGAAGLAPGHAVRQCGLPAGQEPACGAWPPRRGRPRRAPAR